MARTRWKRSQRRAFANQAVHGNIMDVAHRAQVQIETVCRWIREFNLQDTSHSANGALHAGSTDATADALADYAELEEALESVSEQPWESPFDPPSIKPTPYVPQPGEMEFPYLNNPHIRSWMVDEFTYAADNNTFYAPKSLDDMGLRMWMQEFQEALQSGDPQSLFYAMRNHFQKGDKAAANLTETEFNRYYMMAVCTLASGRCDRVQVCLAKDVPPPGNNAKKQASYNKLMSMNQRSLDPDELLEHLRKNDYNPFSKFGRIGLNHSPLSVRLSDSSHYLFA